MWFVISLILTLLFFVFKALARHFYRVTRRNPEDDQPWQYEASVIGCWLTLIGSLAAGVMTVVSWAS